MIKFILKKDAPFIKAGAEFRYDESCNIFVYYDDIGGVNFYRLPQLEKNKEWFEKVEF